MKAEKLHYIPWYNEPHWHANIVLGSKNVYYRFKADWNNRNQSWNISILKDQTVIIQGVQLVLNVDLLAVLNSNETPDCILFPASDNANLERISFENMCNYEVKLYHILREE